MKPGLLRIGLITLAALAGGQDLLACGDKYLMPGRGVGYAQLYKAKVPGSIVIFAPADPAGAGALRSAQLQAALRAVGHRLTVVQDEPQVKKLLAAGGVDIVMSDLGKTTIVATPSPATGARATVVPVMLQGNKLGPTACSGSFECQLKNGDRLERFLTTVNKVMEARAKALKSPRGN